MRSDVSDVRPVVLLENFEGGLGERMKAYEKNVGHQLDRDYPAIVRIDGRAFSTYTAGFKKPFDEFINGAMEYAAQMLCTEIQGAKIAYSQSDEITVLFTACENPDAELWFDGKVQKIVSSAASVATEAFNYQMDNTYWKNKFGLRKRARFDARTFNLPFEEVNNCFLWRQQDGVRNSKLAVGHSVFGHKQLQNKNTKHIEEMLADKGIYWSQMEAHKRHGFCITKQYYDVDGISRSRWSADRNIPNFSSDRNYIGKLVHKA